MKVKSTFENIVLKKVDEFDHLPKRIEEIKPRGWFIDVNGCVDSFNDTVPINLSTKKRAEAFLALMQLVELCEAWNEGWKPDWCNSSQTRW